jgi:hypothetical protein
MEKGSVLQRPISETTNSLSVSDRVRSILGNFSKLQSRPEAEALQSEMDDLFLVCGAQKESDQRFSKHTKTQPARDMRRKGAKAEAVLL